MSQNFLGTTTHNISWFSKRDQAGELQLKAPFQRNPVWSTKQKSYLIDTILRGYPIPELYMQEFSDAEGQDSYVVVDGQQRLRACFEFISGEFPLDGDDSPEWDGMSFEALTPAEKKAIYNYSFVVRLLPDMPETELRSMFQRLNRNVVSLNPQELRHATYWGEFISCVEKIADDDRWSELGVFTPNDVRRMLDIEFIAELAVAYLHGDQNKKEKLDDWFKSYETEFDAREEVEKRFSEVIGELGAILPDMARTRWRKKSDFYSLFTCLASLRLSFPLASEERSKLGNALRVFGGEVDDAIRQQVENPSKDARDYAKAVQKAASDLANRRTRRTVLTELVKTTISGKEAVQ